MGFKASHAISHATRYCDSRTQNFNRIRIKYNLVEDNMKQDDIPEFLNQFSKEGQSEIKALQVQWAKNYIKAYKIAAKELKQEGFFEQLRKDFEEGRIK